MALPAEIGPYVVLGELGRGGMGVVLRARHRGLGAERALKLIEVPAGEASSRLARFEREATALARVRHPSVVAVHECGRVDRWLYFAMDVVEGEPLDRVLRARRFALGEALDVLVALSRGVAALHALGIVHRDLKPSNVVLTPDGRPVLLDLGLAILTDEERRLTRTGDVVGTPAYMAPEQLQSKDLAPSPRIDVYALGLLAFEVLTGCPAVPSAGSASELVGQILHRDRPRLGAIDPDLPAALDALCARAMAREPARRPADAATLAAALEALRASPGPSVRGRRRAWALFGVAALALLGAAGAVAAATGRETGEVASQPAPSTPPHDVAPPRSPRPLDEAALAAGRSALRELRRAEPSARPAAAEAWLAEYPGHPDAAEVEELARRARYEFPARVISSPRLHRGLLLADGERAIGSTHDGDLRCFDLVRGEVRDLQPPGSRYATALTLGPDGSSVLLGALEQREVHWVDASGELRARWPVGMEVRAIAVAPDGRRLAFGGLHPEVLVVDVARGEVVARLGPHAGQVNGLAFTPDGRLVAAVGTSALEAAQVVDLAVYVWDPDRAVRLAKLPAAGKPARVAVLPDGRTAWVGDDSGHLASYDLVRYERGRELEGPRRANEFDPVRVAHLQGLHGVTPSADGRLLYTCSGGARFDKRSGNDFAVWDLEREVALLRRSWPEPVLTLSVAPDERSVLLAFEGRLELWLLPPRDELLARPPETRSR